MVYVVTSLVFAVYLILVWFLPQWLHLTGTNLLILRLGLAIIGLLGAILWLWFYRRMKASRAGQEEWISVGTSEIDGIMREATRRLKNSAVAAGARIPNLPLIYVLGPASSAKTSTVIHSALDPELLSGHVYQDSQVLPTRVLNIWYSRQAVMIDPGGALMTQSADWKHLLRLLQPARLAALKSSRLAPRAALVCFDCEAFLKPGASESTLSAARKIAARLHEIAQGSGISFPVYVLFTKMDRIPFFTEFVRGMTKDEASEVLGSTLPVRSLSAGVYADEETRRLTKAFDELFYALAERRLEFLWREHQAENLAAIYEFPREMRKIRTLLVQFLVDLARPSQLSVNPFLRGFYFSGVRPVIVEDVTARADLDRSSNTGALDAGATRIFTGLGGNLAAAPASVPVATSRKVPQWAFLTQLFNEVIVKDRVALAASGISSRVNLFRRLVLGTVSVLALIVAAGFIVSFTRNYALKKDVRAAVADLRTVQGGSNHEPSFTDLQKLERLRSDLARILDYRTEGAPWTMRWGLYVGDDIYPDARRAYYQRFQQLLFSDAQSQLVSDLRALPQKAGPNDSYSAGYDELKAYLITTSYHTKSSQEFLPRVLVDEWSKVRRGVDAERVELARRQFDFYSADLVLENPFSSANDQSLVDHARNFLQQFGEIDKLYFQMLGAAPAKELRFAETFPNATGIVSSPHSVRGAFTPAGFLYMQDALQKPSPPDREDWVLGPAAHELNDSVLRQKIQARYYQDFINEWRLVLQTSTVLGYRDFRDANQKLEKLTSPTSPLLELLKFVSTNTHVDQTDISNAFQPVAAVEHPSSDSLVVFPENQPYIGGLAKLQGDINTLANGANQTDPSLILAAQGSASAAKATITQVMGTKPDPIYHNEDLVRSLLEQPIKNAEALFGRAPKQAANGAGHDLCSQVELMLKKYPFNPYSNTDLPVEDLRSVVGPTDSALTNAVGKLSQFIVKQGSRYAAAPGANPPPNPGFVAFLNRLSDVSNAFFPNGSAVPHFTYTLKQLPSNVEGLALKIGDQTLSGVGAQKTFAWTGSPEEVQVKGAVPSSYPLGPWSIFRFVGDAHARPAGPYTDLEWTHEVNGHPIMIGGKPEAYTYQLQVSGFNPFSASDISRLRCGGVTVVH